MPAKKRRIEVAILSRYCKGCGLCIDVCPEGVLYMEKTPNKQGMFPAAVRPEGDCVGCLKCATMCPDAAIEIYRHNEAEEKAAAETGCNG